MNFLDIRTVLFSQFITDAVCVIVLVLVFIQNRKKYLGVLYWLLDFTFQTIGSLLILLRGSIPDWLSFVFANVLVVSGALLGYKGLLLFTEIKSSQVPNLVLLAGFFVVHVFYLFVQPDLAVRNFNLSVGLLVLCVQCSWLMLRRVDRGMLRVTRGVGMVFLAFCGVSIIRMVIILAVPNPSNDFFQSGAYDTILIISYQLLLILLTFALVLMVNQRLLEEIQTQEAKFNKAFRSAPYAITLTRASDGKILDVNESFTTITGYSINEAIGKSTYELHLWDTEDDRITVVSELSNGRRIVGRELRFRKRTGELIIGLFSAEIITINDQPYILSSISDITERKQSELKISQYSEHLEEMVAQRTQDLHNTQEQLVRQERLATIGKLAGSVGHELRNPLTTISNAIFYLNQVQPDASDKVKRYLELIDRETRNSEKIISDLLDFARESSVEREAISPSELLKKALYRFPVPENVNVSINVPNDLPSVFVDSRQIIQVLGNLIVNAYQAMPNDGRLVFAGANKDDMIMISVQDNGEGISPENMKKLFEPLFTTKTRGIGLGLTVCKKLIEANSGRINVQSALGKGSTFSVYLPIKKGN